MSQKTESDDMKSQETQLRSKYGNIEKRSGQHLLMKQLAGKKQYFDSGDYNMQLRKGMTTKAPLAAIPNKGSCAIILAAAKTNDETAQINGKCTNLEIKSPNVT